MACTLQYPKKTPYEVRQEMDRIEKSDSKPLTACQINGIDWEKRIQNRQKRRDRETKEADMIKKSLQKKATPESIKNDPALSTVFLLGMSGLLGWKIYNLMHREDKSKKPKQPQYEIIDLSKSASYVMLKRAEETNTKDFIKKLQDRVANNYINSLKRDRDRSLKNDLWRGAVSGGLNGAQYGLLSGLLFGTTVGPAKDLIKGTDRTVGKSIGRGAALGSISGLGAGALLGAGVGAINNWATRDLRKKRAIQKLQELGITD